MPRRVPPRRARQRATAFAFPSVAAAQTIGAAVREAAAALRASGVPEARASAEWLAVEAFGACRTRHAARFCEHAPPSAELQAFTQMLRRRARRTPVQYIVGSWPFHGVDLCVRPPVLVPRPETEGLVDAVLAEGDRQRGSPDAAFQARDRVRDPAARHTSVLDVGCGSGAILAAVLAARAHWRGVGLDVAAEAVALSAENVESLGLRERAVVRGGGVGDVCAGCADGPGTGGRVCVAAAAFDILASNPPYVTDAEMGALPAEVRSFEDERALRGGADGLDVVRDILAHAPRLVRRGGAVLMEVGEAHPAMLAELSFDGLRFERGWADLFGRPRFVRWRVL